MEQITFWKAANTLKESNYPHYMRPEDGDTKNTLSFKGTGLKT
jgi:hypothetical protein